MPNESKAEFTASEYLDIIKAIHKAQTIGELRETFKNEVQYTSAIWQSIPLVSSRKHPNSGRYSTYNMPEEFLDLMKENYSQELGPVTEYIVNLGYAVWVSDLLRIPEFVETGHDKVIRRVMKLMHDGVCVPAFNLTRTGYCFMSFGRPKEDFNEVFIWQIQSFCQHLHIRYNTLTDLLQKKVNFTKRELDVVELMSMGKTNAEISIILNLSVHTVSGYIKSIYLKLGVGDRVSATLRAISLNLLM